MHLGTMNIMGNMNIMGTVNTVGIVYIVGTVGTMCTIDAYTLLELLPSFHLKIITHAKDMCPPLIHRVFVTFN